MICNLVIVPHGGAGQRLGSTHLLFSSSKTVPLGHWQPGTHCLVQGTGSGALHVSGHAVPHSVYSWPSMEQLVPINVPVYVWGKEQ